MNFKESQRIKHEKNRDKIFRDGGKGLFRGKQRDFVLADPKLNLWGGIREDVIHYFKTNSIQWWGAAKNPPGHLLSSQIACLNHLYFIRQREELATAILRNLYPSIDSALTVDDGFVEFEKTATTPLGLEKTTSRGAKCTSIDAMMLGITKNNKRIIFLIEWKYTESYDSTDLSRGKSGATRLITYENLAKSPNCPFDPNYYNNLFYEPFYQMMRQTLLGAHLVANHEYSADDWMHVDVVPRKNIDLKNKVTSSSLTSLGKTIPDIWRKILKSPDKYLMIDPQVLMKPVVDFTDTKTLENYLSSRYW
jgi:hypothetical protein